MASLPTSSSSHVWPVSGVSSGAFVEERNFMWKIENFGSVIKSESMIAAQEFPFEAGLYLDGPVKMKAALRKAPLIEKSRMWGLMKPSIEQMPGIEAFVKLVEKPETLKEVLVKYEMEIKDSEGKSFFKHECPETEVPEADILPLNENGMSCRLMDCDCKNLPLVNGSLIINIKFQLVTVKRAEILGTESGRTKFEVLFEKESLEKCKIDLANIDMDYREDTKIISNDGVVFGVNRNVLVARCPVFQRILPEPTPETPSVLYLNDISSPAIELILLYIYEGVLMDNWFHSNVICELVILSHDFGLDLLNKYLDTMLGNVCSNKNVEQLAQLAQRYSMKTAQKELARYIETVQKRETTVYANAAEVNGPTPQKMSKQA